MKVDLITSENVSLDLLKSIFDDAYLNTTVEGDDDQLLYVEDGNNGCYVSNSENKKEIKFTILATPRKEVPVQKRLEFANKANMDWKAIRTFMYENGRIAFDYYIFINEGITPKSLILTFKTFLGFATNVFNDDENEDIF